MNNWKTLTPIFIFLCLMLSAGAPNQRSIFGLGFNLSTTNGAATLSGLDVTVTGLVAGVLFPACPSKMFCRRSRRLFHWLVFAPR